MESQILQLQNQKTSVEKAIAKNNATETKIFDTVNWEDELKMFSDADINKPARENSYTVDSVKSDSSIVITYTAKESTLPEKKMKIISVRSIVKEIEIENSFNSFYYHSSAQLTYVPTVGYSIKGMRQALFANETSYTIIAKFHF